MTGPKTTCSDRTGHSYWNNPFVQSDYVFKCETHNQVSFNNRYEYTTAPSHNGSEEVRDAWMLAHSMRNYTVPVQLGGRYLGEGPDSYTGPDCYQR